MIKNDEQLNQTRSALNHLEAGLAALKRDVLPLNPKRFALMAEPAVDQINELRGQIDEYIGVNAAITEEASVWMKLNGRDIELGDAPTSVITQILNQLRLGVQTVAGFLNTGVVGGRLASVIKQACDLRIVAWMPGSVQVGLRLPDVDPTLPEGIKREAHRALKLYLQAATWVGSQVDTADLEAELPDPQHRRLLLNQIERIVPRPQGDLESVELYGREMPKGAVQLRRESRERIHRAIELTVIESLKIPSELVSSELVTIEGILREIDLDQRTFIIRIPRESVETRCEIAPQANNLLEIAKEGLDNLVRVVGTRQISPSRRQSLPLHVQEIQVLGKDGDNPLMTPIR